jgi:hypothetical protein
MTIKMDYSDRDDINATSSNSDVIKSGTYDDFDWIIMGAVVAAACQIFGLYLFSRLIGRICPSNPLVPRMAIALMIVALSLTTAGTLKKLFDESEGFGGQDICITCGVILSGIALVVMVICKHREPAGPGADPVNIPPVIRNGAAVTHGLLSETHL